MILVGSTSLRGFAQIAEQFDELREVHVSPEAFGNASCNGLIHLWSTGLGLQGDGASPKEPLYWAARAFRSSTTESVLFPHLSQRKPTGRLLPAISSSHLAPFLPT